MADLQTRRDLLKVENEIKATKAEIAQLEKEGKKINDEVIKQLDTLLTKQRALKKEEADSNKATEEHLFKIQGLQSSANSLQSKFGEIVKKGNDEYFKLADGFRASIGFIGANNLQVDLLGLKIKESVDRAIQLKDGFDDVENIPDRLTEGFRNVAGSIIKTKSLMEQTKGQALSIKQIEAGFGGKQAQEEVQKFQDKFLNPLSARLQKVSRDSNDMGASIAVALEGSTNLTGDLLASTSKLGQEGFQDLVSNAKAQRDEAEGLLEIMKSRRQNQQAELKELMERAQVVKDEPELYAKIMGEIKKVRGNITNTTKDMKTLKADVEGNVEEAERLAYANTISAEAATFILAPFNKLKGMIEALPMGGLASKFIDLEGIMGDAQQEAGKIFGQVATGKMSIDEAKVAFDALGGQTMANLGKGLKAATAGARAFAMAALTNPYIAIAAAIALVGVALYKAFSYAEEMRKEFGTTREEAFELQRAVDTTAMNFKMMGVSAEDVKTLATGIADSMGGVRNVTTENLDAMANLVGTFGMGADKLAPTITAMKALGADSTQAAAAQLEQVGNMAQLEGVAPAKVFEDMTADMETFSKFGKEGGMNLAKASITARKLGVNMGTIAQSADALLDFESSIQSQMEAQMLTGRMINTDKARELALAGDLDGQAREIAKQVGSQAQFDAMNVVQREAMAKAFGITVQDLATMVANQEELNSLTAEERAQREASQKRSQQVNEGMKSMGAELGKIFNQMMEPLKQLMVALGPALGVILKTLAITLKLAFLPLKPVLALINFAIIKPLGFVIGLIGSIVDGMGSVQDVVKGLVPSFDQVKNVLSIIGGVLGAVIMAPIKLIRSAVGFIRDNFMTIAKIVGAVLFPPIALIATIGMTIYKNFDKIKSIIVSLGESIYNFFMAPIQSIKNMISNLLPSWALNLLGFGGEDKTQEMSGEMQGPPTRDAAFKEEFRKQRDEQGRGGEFEFGGEMYSTNYKEEGYDIQPRSSLANAPTSDRMSGTVTATSMTIQGGQVTELKSITKEIKKGNVVSEQIASSTNTSASQTRKLNSSIASG